MHDYYYIFGAKWVATGQYSNKWTCIVRHYQQAAKYNGDNACVCRFWNMDEGLDCQYEYGLSSKL